MLNLETCKRLKEAGFLLEGCHFYYMRGYGSEWFACVEQSSYENSDNTERYACPNSDELIAAICERWPLREFACNQFHYEYEGPYGSELALAWYVEYWDIKSQGHTLVEALAELYIVLNGHNSMEESK